MDDSNRRIWAVERTNENVLTVRVHYKESFEFWVLLTADVHWDNPHCDRALYLRHLELARERDAAIFNIGDWFCAMQGKYDKRADKSTLRPEHQTANYLDALVDTGADYLRPYASNIAMLADGNHETAIAGNHETNLTQRLASALGVAAMGYSGFVRFMFQHNSGGSRQSHTMYFHHGSGGGGAVTKGVIATSRRAVYLPDPTIVVSGHIHEEWQLTLPRVRLTNNGDVYQDEQVHVQLATYKQEFTPVGGWHIQTGKPPKPLGGAWLRFYSVRDRHQTKRIEFEVMRAK